MADSQVALCQLCGEPMPQGEEMFKYHGFSGSCPRLPLPKATPPAASAQGFESWAVSQGLSIDRWENATGGYYDERTHFASLAWGSSQAAASAQGFDAFWLDHGTVLSERSIALKAWEASQAASRSYEDGVMDALETVRHAGESDLGGGGYEEGVNAGISASEKRILALLPAKQKEDGSHE